MKHVFVARWYTHPPGSYLGVMGRQSRGAGYAVEARCLQRTRQGDVVWIRNADTPLRFLGERVSKHPPHDTIVLDYYAVKARQELTRRARLRRWKWKT